MTIGVGGEAIAAWFEEDVDLVMGGEEPLCLPGCEPDRVYRRGLSGIATLFFMLPLIIDMA